MPKKKKRRRRRSTPAKKTRRRTRSTRQKGLPIPKWELAVYGLLALVLGRIVQKYVNLPFVSERAIGLYAFGYVTKEKVKREVIASLAVSLQAETVLIDTGLMPRMLNALPGRRIAGQ